MIKVSLKLASKFWKADDELSSDDEIPAFKKHKLLQRTRFPDMASSDSWGKNEVYIPVSVAPTYPSTSTPNEPSSRNVESRVRTVPVIIENGDETPAWRKKNPKPPQRVIHAIIDDDDDDVGDEKLKWVESKIRRPISYVDLADEDDEEEQDDEVIFLEKVQPSKPYRFFRSKSSNVKPSDIDIESNPITYRYRKQLNEKSVLNVSPKLKAKTSVGITKTYKKTPTDVPKWMQSLKLNKQQHGKSNNRFLNLNGNAKSVLAEVFNLDEKRNYQELIRRVTNKASEHTIKSKDYTLYRSTQKSQESALDDLKRFESDILTDKDINFKTEYGPLTMASINSSESDVELVPSESSTSSSVRIQPVNSLLNSFNKNLYDNKWVDNIHSKYDKKHQIRKDKVSRTELESNIISKLNTENYPDLESRFKITLSLPESVIEEEPAEVELPELTPEQEKLINRALGQGPGGQLLIEKFNLKIHRRDMQTLAGLNWLNDEVINFYMNLLMQRSQERSDLPKVYATNTFFYPKLMQSGQAGLKRWTRKVDIFAHDLVAVPVHLGVHWCMSLIDFRAKKINYLDSMGGRNQACLNALMQYLRDEHQDKKGAPFDNSGWKTECLKDIPQQMNGSDCGMFSCTFAEFSSRNAPYTFTQSHMPYLRRKAVLEILQGKLLL